jgi:hypothetical protein
MRTGSQNEEKQNHGGFATMHLVSLFVRNVDQREQRFANASGRTAARAFASASINLVRNSLSLATRRKKSDRGITRVRLEVEVGNWLHVEAQVSWYPGYGRCRAAGHPLYVSCTILTSSRRLLKKAHFRSASEQAGQ